MNAFKEKVTAKRVSFWNELIVVNVKYMDFWEFH